MLCTLLIHRSRFYPFILNEIRNTIFEICYYENTKSCYYDESVLRKEKIFMLDFIKVLMIIVRISSLLLHLLRGNDDKKFICKLIKTPMIISAKYFPKNICF